MARIPREVTLEDGPAVGLECGFSSMDEASGVHKDDRAGRASARSNVGVDDWPTELMLEFGVTENREIEFAIDWSVIDLAFEALKWAS